MEMKNFPVVTKNAANILDNFPLPNGCGTTLFYSFFCSVVATAMLPVCSNPSIKHVDEASCYFFSFFMSSNVKIRVFSVCIRGGVGGGVNLLCQGNVSVIFRTCPAGILRNI